MAAEIYGQALAQAAGTTLTLLDHSQEKKVYSEYYDAWSQTYVARKEAESAETANLLNLTSMYNTQHSKKLIVGLNQDEAEAQVKVRAAAAGVEGGSVNQLRQQTRVNQGLAVGAVDRETQIKKMQYIDNAGAYRSRMLSLRDPRKVSTPSQWISALNAGAKVVGSQQFGDAALNMYDQIKQSDWWSTGSDGIVGGDRDGNATDTSQQTMEKLF